MKFKALAILPPAEIANKAVALIRSVEMAPAIEAGVCLRRALELPETNATAKAQISAMVEEVFRFFGALEGSKDDRLEIIRTILERYASLNIEEIALVMQKGKAGEFGKDGRPYGKLNGSHILYWLNAYTNSPEKVTYWEKANRAGSTDYVEVWEDEYKEDENGKKYRTGGKVLVNRYRSGSGMNEPDTTAADVLRILHKAPNTDNLVALSANAPALTKAQRLRMEADRIERNEELKQAGILAKRERDRAALLAEEDTERRIKRERDEFVAWIKEHFYKHLTEFERGVLKAGEEGVLPGELMQAHSDLCNRYETLILEWEARPLNPIVTVTK